MMWEMYVHLNACRYENIQQVYYIHDAKKNTIHQLTTMPANSKNTPFPGHNHLLTAGADDLTLWLSPERQRVGGYDLETGHF